MMKKQNRQSSRTANAKKNKQIWEAFAAKSSCDGIVERHQSVRKALGRSKLKYKAHYEGSVMLAKCEKWGYIFSELLYGFGKNEGFYMMKKLEEKGYKPSKRFASWISESKNPYGTRRNSHFAMMQAIGWMKHRRHYGFCGSMIKAAKNMTNTHAQVALLDYFYNASCKDAIPVVVPRLRNDWARARHQACTVLGRIGGKEELRKVQTLANTDTNLTVRVKCRKAAGRISLRI